jgi:hypothetical protein
MNQVSMQFSSRWLGKDELASISRQGSDPQTAVPVDTQQAADVGTAACCVIAISS